MTINLSRVNEKLRKWTQWTSLLNSISSDPDGKEFLAQVFSTNGTQAVAKSGSPVRRSRTVARRLDDVIEACKNFQQPFGLRELVGALESRNFNFRRGDRDVETGSLLRGLLTDNKIRVVREKVGKVGRLYEVLP
jgi:hypothetical protein